MTVDVIPGFYHLQFGLAFPGVEGAEPKVNLPAPEPLYLTNNGEGKQLTVEKKNGQLNQEWYIQIPLKGEGVDTSDRIITPALSKEILNLAVSQGVVKNPDEVSLIKNLQVWTFQQVRDHVYELRSNLYAGLLGSDPLLGVDKEFKKAIIQFIPVIRDPPPRPVWTLLGPLNEKK